MGQLCCSIELGWAPLASDRLIYIFLVNWDPYLSLALCFLYIHNSITKNVNDSLGPPMSMPIISSQHGSFIHSLIYSLNK